MSRCSTLCRREPKVGHSHANQPILFLLALCLIDLDWRAVLPDRIKYHENASVRGTSEVERSRAIDWQLPSSSSRLFHPPSQDIVKAMLTRHSMAMPPRCSRLNQLGMYSRSM